MADQNQTETPREKGRVWGFIFFVFLPILVLMITAWLGRDVTTQLAQRISEQNDYHSNIDGYDAEATEISGADGANAAPYGIVLASGGHTLLQDPTPTPPPLTFATNTPRPEIPVTIPALNTEIAPPAATQAVVSVPPLVVPTVLFPQDAPENLAAPTAVPTRIPTITRNYDLVNIVFFGSDEEVTDDNTIRTDTMIVASINRDTGTVSMLSLPRDMFVYIPGLGMNRLNVTFGWGENAGWEPGGGFGLFRQTILYNFGINVHYYAKVNLTEFEQIIDLLGGVEIAVDCALTEYYPIAPIEELDLTRPVEENYQLRTLDVGYYTLDGFDATWYARSRSTQLSDFDRGRRQQKV
ncbi:MAG: LCP family protein, partial [Chloroflexota bacterium]